MKSRTALVWSAGDPPCERLYKGESASDLGAAGSACRSLKPLRRTARDGSALNAPKLRPIFSIPELKEPRSPSLASLIALLRGITLGVLDDRLGFCSSVEILDLDGRCYVAPESSRLIGGLLVLGCDDLVRDDSLVGVEEDLLAFALVMAESKSAS